MVIRDVGRVMGLPYGFIDSISKMIPFDPSRPQNLTQCIAGEPRLQKLINEDTRVKKLTELSLKLEGLNRNVATHAAGVVIADKKLTEVVPLYKDTSADLLLPSTQFDMYSAENAGLIKFDFLGLKTLTVINNTQKLVRNLCTYEILGQIFTVIDHLNDWPMGKTNRKVTNLVMMGMGEPLLNYENVKKALVL